MCLLTIWWKHLKWFVYSVTFIIHEVALFHYSQVNEAYVPYAMKAKQIDMKKLKAAIWESLTNSMIVTISKEVRIFSIISLNYLLLKCD